MEKIYIKKPFSWEKSSELIYRGIIFFFLIAVVSKAFPLFEAIYYAVPILCTFFIGYEWLFRRNFKNTLKSGGIILPFCMWAVFSSVWSLEPSISLMRAAYFLVIALGIFSFTIFLTENNFADIWKLLFFINLIIIVLSLISLILGIPANNWTGGNGKGFMGFSFHQNTLASLILFTSAPLIYNLYEPRTKHDRGKPRKFILIYFLLFMLNIFILILTYSRASIISFILFLFGFFLIVNAKKTLIAALLLLITFGTLWFLSSNYQLKIKNMLTKGFNSPIESRIYLWEASYRAALDGGLFGLGYGISGPLMTESAPGRIDRFGRFIREKGNSTLAIVEETGLIGLVLFLIPAFTALKISFKKIFYKERDISSFKTAALVIALIIALSVHAQFEAWWTSVTSPQLFIFILFISIPFNVFN